MLMGDIRTEPSMDEILASIKRIIADDGLAPNGTRPGPRPDPADPEPLPTLAADPVIEPAPPPPTPPEAMAPPPSELPAPTPPVSAAPSPTLTPQLHERTPSLVSEDAACASRQALSSLSSMVLRAPGADNTLDNLVRDMLRPLLKEWLDARLPGLVESLVAREIARITGEAL